MISILPIGALIHENFVKDLIGLSSSDPETFSGAREIHLNAEYKDPSLIRNKLSFDFFHDLGVLAPQSQHINLSRNGSHKGVYLQLESVDEFFLKKRGLPMGPIYYAVNNNANFSLMRDEKMKDSLLSGYQRALETNRTMTSSKNL